ncbi:MAG: carboxypeptidase regulatory-like domain-containing protein, partial [Acidobacteria bacterium]|nr:carboxypeptidase regulatory-like domain-containing protein [Acidobacteriota bacterium]
MHSSRWSSGNKILIAGFLLISLQRAAAQSTAADIVGTVRDSSGAVVPNALIKAVQEETNSTRETRSNTEGIYEFRILQPGTYTLSAEATGFKKYVNARVPLLARQVLRVDIAIEVGSVADTINVVAEAPVINTDVATVAESR